MDEPTGKLIAFRAPGLPDEALVSGSDLDGYTDQIRHLLLDHM